MIDPEDLNIFQQMCGSTPVMSKLFRSIEHVARSDATVLVIGESGTGKELVAKALHTLSSRANRPFIALNCSALPAELVESELFGHVRGAFTGATSDHAGLFQAAHNGTLFLDEIGDLAPITQAKVLRVLENGELLRVGSARMTRVDVRVLAATNRPLEQMVAAGSFRQDLLYRLKVIELVVPPLRERREDIPQLVRYFLAQLAERDGVARVVDDDAMPVLLQYGWPGNVRELRNVLLGATVMTGNRSRISELDLPENVRSHGDRSIEIFPTGPPADSPSFPPGLLTLPFNEAREQALRSFDCQYLGAALEQHDGNIAQTARTLGLHRQSLQKLLVRCGLRSRGGS